MLCFLASEVNYAEQANTFEKIVGQEIDRLNNDITELEKARDAQKKEILLYDSILRGKLEEVNQNKTTIETLKKAIQELESDPESEELRDELIKMEKENDSLKFQRYQYDAQLRIEIERRREIETKIEDLQKMKTTLENTVETKEKSILEKEKDKEAFRNALFYLQTHQPFSNANIIQRTKNIQYRLIIEQQRNKELEENTSKLKEEIKCIEIKNKELLQEARQHLDMKMNEMGALLLKQKEDLCIQWKTEVIEVKRQEEEKRKSVTQQRDEMMQRIQELNCALKETE